MAPIMMSSGDDGGNEDKPSQSRAPAVNAKGVDVAQMISDADSMSVGEYLQSIAGTAPIRVKIERKHPLIWRGKNVGGMLKVTEDYVTEEDIKNEFGGGKYAIRVEKADRTGNYKYAGQRTIQIAGDPIFGGGLNEDGHGKPPLVIGSSNDGDLTKQAMGMVERLAEAERERADRLEEESRRASREAVRQSGFDPALFELIQAPLRSVVEEANRRADAAQRQIDNLQQVILTDRNKPPEQNPLLEKIVHQSVFDGEGRLNTVKEQHASELRMLKENHRDDLKRAEDRYDRQLDDATKRHDREVDNIRRSHDSELNMLRSSYDSRIALLEAEIRRISKESEERKIELTELRKQKDKPMSEQIIEMATVADAFQTLKGDEEEKSTFDKVMEQVGPILQGIGARVANPPTAGVPGGIPGQPQAPQNPAAQRIVQRRQQTTRPGQPGQPAVPRIAVSGGPSGPAPVNISAEDIKVAVQYTEGAILAGTSPEQFAQSVVSIVPSSIVQAIRQEGGFDKLLENRVQLGATSPLATQLGRRFLRNVERALNGDTPTNE